MKDGRPTSAWDDLFAPRELDVRPLAERMGRPGGVAGTGGAARFEGRSTEAAEARAGQPEVRSLFAPPPAAPPPPPVPPEEDPVVQQQLEALQEAAEVAGMRNAERRIAALMERYTASIDQLGHRLARSRPQAADVVSLAMVVAREIVGRELRVDGEPLVMALEDALRQVGQHPVIVVRLARGDLDFVKRRLPDLAARGIELELDETLGPGGCVVEAPEQIVDASIEARLAAARDAVAAALDRDHDHGAGELHDEHDHHDDHDDLVDAATGQSMKVVA